MTRLDLDVDGTDNTVYMSESYAEPMGPDNPYGLSVVQRSVPLRTESEGIQDMDFATQRALEGGEPQRRQRAGHPPGLQAGSRWRVPVDVRSRLQMFQRATVIGHTLWVTPNHPEERWPAGEFVNQSATDTGLGAWTKANRSIDNTDVVLWYVFGHPPHHPARGLADHARGHRVVLAQAVRVLRPQPVAGRTALAAEAVSQLRRPLGNGG